ncbi:MAG: DUF2231 domain-containing protein [Actinomycetales bacterium]
MTVLENLTVLGLPAHPLLIHAVVAGIPVMALAGLAMLTRARWRRSWAWPVAVADVLLVPLAFVTAQTGQGLQRALGREVALDHGEMGELVPWFTVVMAAAAVAFAALRGRGRVATAVAAVALVVSSVAATGWVVVTGHLGAESSWGFVEIG